MQNTEVKTRESMDVWPKVSTQLTPKPVTGHDHEAIPSIFHPHNLPLTLLLAQ